MFMIVQNGFQSLLWFCAYRYRKIGCKLYYQNECDSVYVSLNYCILTILFKLWRLLLQWQAQDVLLIYIPVIYFFQVCNWIKCLTTSIHFFYDLCYLGMTSNFTFWSIKADSRGSLVSYYLITWTKKFKQKCMALWWIVTSKD